jgi:tetratricopeptide (TPR) repeat protein
MDPTMSDDSKTERMPREPIRDDKTVADNSDKSGTGLVRGAQFGRYLILHQVGAGGMGAVYAAHDPVLDRKVALKVLRGRVESAEAEQRLRREAQAMARLNHPNVVTVHDAGTHDNQPYVAMEFVVGQDLEAWLKAGNRGWREIVDVFTDAGKGLAAAHDAGLVHRDFKLSNVMVGDDGRARVTDFGLARAAESGEVVGPDSPSMTLPLGGSSTIASSPLDTPLTEEGFLLGTPSFMAPEQAFEYRANKQSDQYSFCVSLFIALFGRHPLGDSSTIPEYLARLQVGQVEPPPSGHDVPEQIMAAIERGLSRSPDDRFPDMRELLEELRFDPQIQRKRRLLAGLGVAVLLAVVIGGVLYRSHQRNLCSSGESRIASVCGQARMAALSEHFSIVAASFGAEALSAVQARLDGYARSWAAVYREACEATHMRGEHSEELLDRQMACLNRRLYEADHLLALLAAADRDLIASSLDAVVGLRSPEVCEDAMALVDRLSPPEDAESRSRIKDLEEGLAAAEADRLVGDYQASLDRLTDFAATAREIDYAPLLAETMISKGHLEGALGLPDNAEISLREALVAAEDGRDDRASVVAATNLMWVAGYLRSDFDEAEYWGAFAAAKVARLGGDDRLGAELADTQATVLVKAGRYREAQVLQEQVLEGITRFYGADSLDAAMAMTTMGHVLSSIGEYEKAVDYYRQSLDLKERLAGPDHPTVSFTAASLAQAYGGLGDNRKAVDLARRALAIQEHVFGPEDPQIAIALNNLAYGLEGLGQFDEARAAHERSMEVVSNSWGPEHPQIAYSLLNLSSLEKQAGNFEAALTASRRAGEILMAAYGSDHPLYAYAANNTGVYLMLTGRANEGVVHLEKALAIRTADAADPVLVSVTRFNLGRALWEAGQRDRGRKLVRQAKKELQTLGNRAMEDLEAVEKWLVEH